MLRQKRLPALLMAVLMLCAMCMNTYAYPVPDLSRKGSVKITMLYEEKAVSGGVMTLYRVGDIRESNGTYDFVLTGNFADSGVRLTEISSPELAKKLESYAAKTKQQGEDKEITEDGTTVFTELEPGLYLVVQTEAAEGYIKASPFLVSVPMLEKGAYVYDVEAGPKVEFTPVLTPGVTSVPVPSPKPDKVITPTAEPRPGTSDSKLPQTGQLNWPVPVLAILGLGLFSVGWILRYGRRNDDEK